MSKYRDFTDEELKWIKSFERVMKKAPSSLFFFVGAGQTIYPKDENGNRYMTSGHDGAGDVVDQSCDSVDISTPMECDGGDC